jgi:hypothetical protein
MTATRSPDRSWSWFQAAEWKVVPAKFSIPGITGMLGADSGPIAEISRSAVRLPRSVSIVQRDVASSQCADVIALRSRTRGSTP